MEFFNNKSKGIFKTEEDTCKRFTAECLQGDPIHAIDIDTIYHTRMGGLYLNISNAILYT